jgi:Mrp family chromosome partitioning ATPase
MSVFARITTGINSARLAGEPRTGDKPRINMADKADRLHEHDAVRDVVARLLAAMESLAGEGRTAGERHEAETASAGVAFLFTSLRPGQGTSTVAAAVARGLAESGRRTLLAVVGKPGAESGRPGSMALKDVVDTPHPIRFEQPPLLTVHVPPRLTELPESAHNPRAWVDGFHVLIIDAPTLTDGLTRYWVPRVHGVVLILDGEKTAVRAVVQAREDLERIGGRLVGVVLNRYRSRIPRWLAPYFVYG